MPLGRFCHILLKNGDNRAVNFILMIILTFPFFLKAQSSCPCEKDTLPIHCAIEINHCGLDFIKQIVLDGEDVNKLNGQGETPLHRMGYIYRRWDKKQDSIVVFLLEKGANPLILDHQGNNALDKALYWGHYKLADLYLRKNIKPAGSADNFYYSAWLNGNKRRAKRIKWFEKTSEIIPYVHLPISVTGNLWDIKNNTFTVQTGAMVYNDDFYIFTSSFGVLVGPSFTYDFSDFGFDATAFITKSWLHAAVSYQKMFTPNRADILEPKIGLSFGPVLSLAYGYRIPLENKKLMGSNISLRFTWPYTGIKIPMRFRRDYYESQCYF